MYEKFIDATFTNDYLFYQTLIHNEDITRDIIQLLANVTLTNKPLINFQHTIRNNHNEKNIILDVIYECDDIVYVIEMQRSYDNKVGYRSRHYIEMISNVYPIKGKQYDQKKKIFVIFICGYDVGKKHLSLYDISNPLHNDTIPTGITTYLYNYKSKNDFIRDEVKSFLDYCNGIVSDDCLVQRIDGIIKEIKKDELMKGEFDMLSLKASFDKLVIQQEAYEKGIEQGKEHGVEKGIEQGIELGVEKGIEKGIEQGIELGVEKGIEKGIEQGIELGVEKGSMEKGLEIAIKLLKDHDDFYISQITDLSMDKIKQLRTA